MMNNIISKWVGTVEYNNQAVGSDFNVNALTGTAHFIFNPNTITKTVPNTTEEKKAIQGFDYTGTYRISVKSYMTKKATPEFDFMEKWNNNKPMPLMTMVGEKVKETKGMVYMKLHGDITTNITERCLCCGKPITNPISKYFGMGPVCGGHNYTNPFDSEEELKQAVGAYRKKLQSMTWEGWIIKSAITEEVEL